MKMKCLNCGLVCEFKPVVRTLELKGSGVSVEDVPVYECSGCREPWIGKEGNEYIDLKLKKNSGK